MRSGNILFSAVHFFVVFFIIALGAFFLALPYAFHFRFALADALVENPDVFAKIGIGIFISGLLLFVGFYVLNRKRYIQLKMDVSKASIEEAIIRDYVYDYWKGLFPQSEVMTDVVITGKQDLEIIANLPKVVEESEELFESIQDELSVILSRRLGYEREFCLTLVPDA